MSSLYEHTLQLLKLEKRATGAALARIEGCKATAMNNRLAGLKRHGLVKCEVDGRQTFYELLKRKPEPTP